MGKNIKSIIVYILSLILGVILLYLVFKNISFDDFIAKAEMADYNWVYLSIAVSLTAYFARAYRWNLLIKPLGYEVTTWRTTSAVMIGYLVNLVLPRAGEITRCGVLKKSDNVPMTISIGTVISERIIDVLTLLLITLSVLVLEFDKLSTFLLSLTDYINTEKLIILAIAGIVCAFICAAATYWLLKTLQGKFRVVLNQLLEGLFSLRKIENIKGFIIATVIMWGTYFLMGYLIFFSIPETSELGWQVGLMLLVSGGIALTIPVQGGFGTYHTIVSSMLLLYGIDNTTGVFFATLVHSAQVVGTVIIGIIGLVMTIFTQPQSPSGRS